MWYSQDRQKPARLPRDLITITSKREMPLYQRPRLTGVWAIVFNKIDSIKKVQLLFESFFLGLVCWVLGDGFLAVFFCFFPKNTCNLLPNTKMWEKNEK